MSYAFPRRWRYSANRDPLLTEMPHDLWILPAHLSEYGPFEILGQRDLEKGPTRRLFLDIKIVATGEPFTLILPLTLASSAVLTRWERMERPTWHFVVGKADDDSQRWVLQYLFPVARWE